MEERLLGLMAFETNRGDFAGTGLESTSLRNPYACEFSESVRPGIIEFFPSGTRWINER